MKCKGFIQSVAMAAFFAAALQVNAQLSTDSLILHLPMDGDASDISGNGNNGTLFNVLPASDRFGTENGAFGFNGFSSTIEIPASPTINKIQTVDQITIAAWVKRNNVSADVFAIIERYNPAIDASYILELNTYLGGIAFVGNPSGPAALITCNYANWNASQWYHVAFSYSKTSGIAKFYVDGANVCSIPYAQEIEIADSTASFFVGRSLTGPNEYSNGLIDDLKVYYRALSDAEIVTSVELERPSKNSISVYPNPSIENMSIDNLPIGCSVSITDLTGKVLHNSVSESNLLSIRTSQLRNGVYLIRVENKGNSVYRKFVINK